MAAIAEMPLVSEPAPTKKGRSRKALKQKVPSSNEANILAGTIPQPSPVAAPSENCPTKENYESLSSQPLSQKKSKRGASKAAAKQQQPELSSFEKEMQEMQEKLQQLRLEKEQTEELLKVKEEALKQNEEEKEKLHLELKKLQKVKEFKPTMTFPMMQSLKDNEQEKKGKKKGDPPVKRPSPPYALWCKDQWNEVKKANPEAEFKEISTLLGAKWKTISPEEKKPYEEKYQAEKETYLKIVGNEKREHEAMKLLEEEQKQKTAMELLEQYMQFKQEQEAEKENKKTSKKEKDPLKPKQPLTAFFLYSNERRATLLAENKNVLEVAKILGEEWKNMTEKQRAPYEKVANKNKEQYLHEMELYRQKKEEEAANLKKEEEELMKLQKQEALQLLKKKEKTENIIKKTKEKRQKKKEEKDVDPNKPKKPASSFLLFSKEARKSLGEERPGINNSTLNALISVKWKELNDEEKQIWNDKAAKAMEAYKKELEEYNSKLVAENQKNLKKKEAPQSIPTRDY